MARGDKGPLHHPHPAARICSGMIVFPTVAAFEGALHTLPVPDEAAIAEAMARQASLTKPAGSLGQLEEIALFIAGWQSRARPRMARGQAIIFAGNHGVTKHGVSAFPPEVTAQMVANFETRSEEHTSELQSLMRTSSAVFRFKK